MENGKPVFGLIVGTRGCFNAQLATRGGQRSSPRSPRSATATASSPRTRRRPAWWRAVRTGEACGRYLAQHRDVIDGLVVVLPNFGDELGIVNAVRSARLEVPVLLQACDDHLDQLSTAERRDAFCGKISVANNFYQYEIPFTDTTLFSCDLESAAFTADLRRFEKVCRVHRGLRHARIGAIGARPTDFQTMRSSEKLLQASGSPWSPAICPRSSARPSGSTTRLRRWAQGEGNPRLRADRARGAGRARHPAGQVRRGPR